MTGDFTNAERQARYRARQGARVGKLPGPEPSAPCGTTSAYKRHKRNKEPVDDACRLAYNTEQRRLYKQRNS